jgi:hypothetical protein
MSAVITISTEGTRQLPPTFLPLQVGITVTTGIANIQAFKIRLMTYRKRTWIEARLSRNMDEADLLWSKLAIKIACGHATIHKEVATSDE